jgi:hypothetical protein
MKSGSTINMNRDDSLFGLLSSYKSNTTYVRVMVDEEKQLIELQLTDNPKNWQDLGEIKSEKRKILRRLELGVSSLSVKYISPSHLVKSLGPFLGLTVSADYLAVSNQLEEKNCYSISTSLKYRFKVIQAVRKLINLKPQKKFELLEKSIVLDQEHTND